MNNDIVIKKYDKHSSDIGQITSEISVLAGEIWREHYVPIIGIKQVEYMLNKYQSPKQIYEDICKNDFIYFTAEHDKDNKLVGYAACQPRIDHIYLSKIYVHKDNRGNGISRIFINEIESICKEHTLHKICLSVNKHNKDTIAIYNKMGFKTIDSIKVDIGDGFFMDDFVMEKTLINQ